MRKKTLGQHIVADPEICHGQPTFRGTRIRVAQVLKQVAQGMDWDKSFGSGGERSADLPSPKPCNWPAKRSRNRTIRPLANPEARDDSR